MREGSSYTTMGALGTIWRPRAAKWSRKAWRICCEVGMAGMGPMVRSLRYVQDFFTIHEGAANLVDPYASKNIIEALPAAMQRYGIARLSDIVGAALA